MFCLLFLGSVERSGKTGTRVLRQVSPTVRRQIAGGPGPWPAIAKSPAGVRGLPACPWRRRLARGEARSAGAAAVAVAARVADVRMVDLPSCLQALILTLVDAATRAWLSPPANDELIDQNNWPPLNPGDGFVTATAPGSRRAERPVVQLSI